MTRQALLSAPFIYLADVAVWCWAFMAYWLVMVLPVAKRGSLVDRLTLSLLPWAGYYGYHEPWMTWRWSRRPKTKPDPAEGCPL